MYAFVFADVKQALIQWQERIEFAHKLLTLLNSYSPPELRNACIGKLLRKYTRIKTQWKNIFVGLFLKILLSPVGFGRHLYFSHISHSGQQILRKSSFIP